jgi:glutaredoxin-like protein
MTILDNESKAQLKEFFEKIDKKVEVILITDENNKVPQVDFNQIAKELMEELKEVSNGKFDYTVRENDSAFAKALGIDTEETSGKFGPTFVFKDNPRMIFLGLPAGHEFSVFMEDITILAHGHAHIPEDLAEKIKGINRKLEVIVFVTPTCPYCPQMSFFAHSMAYLNENIRGIVVDATEFPEFANAFSVMGVPRTIVRDAETKEVLADQEGAVPLELLLNKFV